MYRPPVLASHVLESTTDSWLPDGTLVRRLPASRREPGTVAISSLALLLLLFACSPARDGPGQDALSALPAAHKVFVSTVGASEDAPFLYETKDGAILPNGSFVVLSGSQVHFYSADGTFLKSMGGIGSGPGEFRAPRSVEALMSGQIAVWDVELARMTIVDHHGLVRTYRVDLGPFSSVRPRFVGATTSGDTIAFLFEDRRSVQSLSRVAPGVRLDSVRYFVQMADSMRSAPLVELPGPKYYLSNDGHFWAKNDFIFPHDFHVATARDGFFIGNGGTGTIQYVSLLASTERVAVIQRSNRQYTPDEIEAERKRRIRSYRSEFPKGITIASPGLSESRQKAIQATPANRFYAAFDRLEASGRHELWIRRPVEEGDSLQMWVSLSRIGKPQGRLSLSAHEHVLDVAFGRILTLRTDEMGIETVALYRTVWTRTADHRASQKP